MNEMPEELKEKRGELASKEHVYEPKYSIKEHSVYKSMSLYQVNYERAQAFCSGFDACYELMKEREAKLIETLKFYSNQKSWENYRGCACCTEDSPFDEDNQGQKARETIKDLGI